MTVPEFEQAAHEGDNRTAHALGAGAGPRKTRLDCVRAWVFCSSLLVAAAVLAGAAYWGCVLARPDPLFAPAISEDGRAPRPTSGA